MASWNCGGIAQHNANCASSRGVATEAKLLSDCVRASVICKQAAVDRLPVVLWSDSERRCTLVRGRGVSATAYYARRDPSAINELAGLEALLDAVLSC